MTVEETVAGRVSSIELLNRHIRETKSLIETAVEQVCDSFDGTARLSQQNFERTTNFLGQDGGQHGQEDSASIAALIGGSEKVLHHLLDRLAEASEKSRSAIQRLKEIDARIVRVTHMVDQINDITVSNRILAVNARIQAAQLGEQGRGFGVVADEITMQARRSTEFSASIATLIEQLRASDSMSCEDLVDLASHDGEAMEESKQEVVLTHADFRLFLDRSQNFLREAAADCHRVAGEIHASVRGLQFQDRASQRLEFIATELERIGAEMALEFHVTARDGHEAVGEMMTLTSMREQREPAACLSAGEVELF